MIALARLLSCFAISFVLGSPAPLRAEEPAEAPSRAFGDFGGARTWLSENGASFDAVVTHDLFRVFRGAQDRTGGGLGNVDLSLNIDTTAANWWDGGSFFFYALGNYGRTPSSLTGEIQVSDNIEAYSTAKLYEAWYEHQFLDGAVSLLLGLHDYNSEFYSVDAAGNLLNSSFGIGVDAAQVGPSIFNTTALAARARVIVNEQWYALGAVYDGLPGDPNNPRGTRIRLGDQDGVFSALEVGYVGHDGDRLRKVGVGGWYHTAQFEDFSEAVRDRNHGFYGVGELALLTPESEGAAVNMFVQAGRAKPSVNQIGSYFGAGLQWVSPFGDRPDDALSLGAALARPGAAYKRFDEASTSMESIFEINYRTKVSDYFYLTPDLQFINDPGASVGSEDAVIGFIRAELAL